MAAEAAGSEAAQPERNGDGAQKRYHKNKQNKQTLATDGPTRAGPGRLDPDGLGRLDPGAGPGARAGGRPQHHRHHAVRMFS